MYKIIVYKYEPNPDYEAELARHKEERDKNFGMSRMDNRFSEEQIPQKENVKRSMEVFLTEEEYKKVKAEVIKTFE